MRRALTALVAALALAVPSAAVAAQCPRTTVADVEEEVMCPVCGMSLALATEAPQAERQRELIRRLVEDCRSKEEVKDVLAAEFGDEVLATPGDDGFDLAAYLVPALGLLLGALAVAATALAWRRRGREQAAPPAPDAPGGAAGERLDADLRRYEL